MVRICFLILGWFVGMMPVLAQQTPSSLPLRLANTLVFRVDATHRAACGPDHIAIASLTQKLQALKGSSLQAVFPHHAAPDSATDRAGREMIDLSLLYRVEYTADIPEEAAAEALAALPAVVYAEPWYVHELFYQPDDPRADTSGGATGMWHLAQIKAREAWDLERNDTSVVIGVVDSGTEGTHPDLLDNVAFNYGDPIDGLDNDQDGFIDNYKGWDFGGNSIGALGDNDPSVGNVHGLWVTGIVGATADNNRGLPGICFNCRYLPVKAAPDDSVTIITGGYPGIVYAADQGADVINCSWGSSFKSKFGEEVVGYASINRGAAVVAAAGNDMADKRNWPAAYETVISVANTSIGDTICCNSTFDYTIDMSAPGQFIVSTFGAAGYWAWGGTSASAPVAAGAIGLTKAHFPQYTAAQAAQRVRVTCDPIYDINPGYVDKLGSGRVNMYRALTDPALPSVRVETLSIRDVDGDGALAAGDTLAIELDLLNYLEPTEALSVKLSIPGIQQGFVELLQDSSYVGEIETMSIRTTTLPFRLKLRESMPQDLLLALRFTFSDPNLSYTDVEVREHRVNPSYIDITESELHTTVNSQGNFGFNDFFQQEEGLGLIYKDKRNVLAEGGLMLATAANRVSDRIRNVGFRDLDFQATLPVVRQYGQELPPFTSISRFTDGFAPQPLGVSVIHHSYAFADSAYQSFVIFRYILRNDRANPLSNLYAGLFADWDITPLITPNRVTTRNAASNSSALKLGYTFDVRQLDSTYYGVALLTEQGFRTYAGDVNATTFGASTKFSMLTGQPSAATGSVGLTGEGVDAYQVVSGGPMSLVGGASDTITFAVLAGRNLNELQAGVTAAEEAYECRILGKGPLFSFFVSDTLVAREEIVAFNDQNENATQWAWDFGDGNSSTISNPAHSYNEAGQYTVTLTASNAQCTRTFTRTLTVSPAVSVEAPMLVADLMVVDTETGWHLKGDNWPVGPLQVSLWSLQGKTLHTLRVNGAATWSAAIPAEGLAKGFYVIRVVGRDQQLSYKVQVR